MNGRNRSSTIDTEGLSLKPLNVSGGFASAASAQNDGVRFRVSAAGVQSKSQICRGQTLYLAQKQRGRYGGPTRGGEGTKCIEWRDSTRTGGERRGHVEPVAGRAGPLALCRAPLQAIIASQIQCNVNGRCQSYQTEFSFAERTRR